MAGDHLGEVIRASDKKNSWVSNFGGLPGVSTWEETSRSDYVSNLGWDCLGILEEELKLGRKMTQHPAPTVTRSRISEREWMLTVALFAAVLRSS